MAISWIGFGPWFNAKVVHPLLQILRKGAEPKQLAFSTALGITLGVFPICATRERGGKSKSIWLQLLQLLLVTEEGRGFKKVNGEELSLKPLQYHIICPVPERPTPPWLTSCHSSVQQIILDRGVTVFLCGMAIAVLGSLCHPPSMMLANFIATPLELSLLVPFLRFGEALTGGAHFPLTADALKKVLTGQASPEVLLSIVHALLGWLVAAPFILAALYILFLPCFKVLLRKFSSGSLSPKKLLLSPSDSCHKVRDV